MPTKYVLLHLVLKAIETVIRELAKMVDSRGKDAHRSA
ncbi:hypothetical protein UCCLBBS124_0045 [Levilactobacillus brevis]|nr:hypothetical protein UCCLBBS124_0045 [Levilactobacillus brevis]